MLVDLCLGQKDSWRVQHKSSYYLWTFLRVNSQEFRIIWRSVPFPSATVQCAKNHVRVKVHTALYPCVLWSARRSVSSQADRLFIKAPFAHGQTHRKVIQIASWRRWAFRDLCLSQAKAQSPGKWASNCLLPGRLCGLQVPWSFSDYWLCSLPVLGSRHSGSHSSLPY